MKNRYFHKFLKNTNFFIAIFSKMHIQTIVYIFQQCDIKFFYTKKLRYKKSRKLNTIFCQNSNSCFFRTYFVNIFGFLLYISIT